MPPSIHVGDIFDNTTELMIATVSPPKAVLKVREKSISFCKLLQSLKNDFLSGLDEKMQKADWMIAGGM